MAIMLVRPEGLEPSTLGLRVPCSAKLSYGRTAYIMESAGAKRKPSSMVFLFSYPLNP